MTYKYRIAVVTGIGGLDIKHESVNPCTRDELIQLAKLETFKFNPELIIQKIVIGGNFGRTIVKKGEL